MDMQHKVEALKIEELCVQYGDQLILDKVSLNISQGDFFGLLGLNGAGKSTLIKSLLDFQEVMSGKILHGGVDHLQTVSRSNLAYLPEKFSPPYYLTGRHFLNYMLDLYEVEKDEKTILEMMVELDLDSSVLKKPVKKYSKGMAQKLGLIACFLSQKRVLILDEPMSGLDPKARVLVKKQMQRLNEQGCTIFFSSHLLSDVEELANKMSVLYKKKIAFLGTPKDFKGRHHASSLEQAFMAEIAAFTPDTDE